MVFLVVLSEEFTVQPKPLVNHFAIFVKFSKSSYLSMIEFPHVFVAVRKVKVSFTLSSEIRDLATIYLSFGISYFSFSLQVST